MQLVEQLNTKYFPVFFFVFFGFPLKFKEYCTTLNPKSSFVSAKALFQDLLFSVAEF